MNTPDESITYVTVEPIKEDLSQGRNMNRPQLSGTDVGGSGNLDKVREILFGSQIQEYEKRFNRLEERLGKECASLRDDTRKRLDYIETYIKQEIESLAETVKKQQAAQEQALKELEQETKNQTDTINQKISDIDQQASRSASDLRQQILEQSKNLDDELRQKVAEMLAVIERESLELRTDKANRSTLSNMFAEIAIRLRSEQ